MRFILRTLEQQAKVENRPPLNDNPNDYAVIIDGPVVGRIYLRDHEPSKSKWFWFLQSPIGASGMSDTLEEARSSLKERWFVETQKLSAR